MAVLTEKQRMFVDYYLSHFPYDTVAANFSYARMRRIQKAKTKGNIKRDEL